MKRAGASGRVRTRKSARTRSRRPIWRRALRLTVTLALLVLLPIAGAVIHKAQTLELPTPGSVPGDASRIDILAADGTLIASRGSTARYVPIASMPQHLIDAVLATEDRRFYHHLGVDPIGLVRALTVNWQAGAVVQAVRASSPPIARIIARMFILSTDVAALGRMPASWQPQA